MAVMFCAHAQKLMPQNFEGCHIFVMYVCACYRVCIMLVCVCPYTHTHTLIQTQNSTDHPLNSLTYNMYCIC